MLRRPQRTEARLRAGGENGAYLCGSLEGGGELKQWPRAQPSGSRCGWSASTGRTTSFAAAARREHYVAARGVRRSNARGVRAPPMQQDSSCMPWQSAGEQRRPRQCELSSGQKLEPALTLHREWRHLKPVAEAVR